MSEEDWQKMGHAVDEDIAALMEQFYDGFTFLLKLTTVVGLMLGAAGVATLIL